MEWRIWITWWIIFYIKYFRLFSIYIKKLGDKLLIFNKNIYKKKKKRIQSRLKSLGSTKSSTSSESSTEVVLVQCNIANNNYQHNSRVLYTFICNKLFGLMLDISRKKIIFFKLFDSEFHILKAGRSRRENKHPLVIN